MAKEYFWFIVISLYTFYSPVDDRKVCTNMKNVYNGFEEVIILTLGVNYKKYCRLCPNHVACKNPGNFHTDCPQDRRLLEMTSEVRELIVDYHNRQRSWVAAGKYGMLKTACRMGTMQWDDELALLAEYNVKGCAVKRDKCLKTMRFPSPGQNIGFSTSIEERPLKEAVEVILKKWYREIENVHPGIIDSYNENMHLVMVNDHNVRVGCAASDYTVYHESEYKLCTLLTCNYATSNKNGAPVYDANCTKSAVKCLSDSKISKFGGSYSNTARRSRSITARLPLVTLNRMVKSKNIQSVHATIGEGTLVHLEETERRFDEFQRRHRNRLQKCLDLRKFEKALRDLRSAFHNHLKNVSEMVEIAEGVARGIYAWEIIQHKCNELPRICGIISEILKERSEILNKNRELVKKAEKGNEWCANNVELLMSQRIESCSSSTELSEHSLQEIQTFVASATDFELHTSSEFKKTPETKALVSKN
uniref:SCP domain-containing protein n=1 Tax=Glossina pallidipes TaxID=7398 RepID=A0A1A9ZJ28_GLOPL